MALFEGNSISTNLIEMTLEDGKKWWDRLKEEDRQNVLEDVYRKHWMIGRMIEDALVDPLTEDFKNHSLFRIVLDMVNLIRKEISDEKLKDAKNKVKENSWFKD